MFIGCNCEDECEHVNRAVSGRVYVEGEPREGISVLGSAEKCLFGTTNKYGSFEIIYTQCKEDFDRVLTDKLSFSGSKIKPVEKSITFAAKQENLDIQVNLEALPGKDLTPPDVMSHCNPAEGNLIILFNESVKASSLYLLMNGEYYDDCPYLKAAGTPYWDGNVVSINIVGESCVYTRCYNDKCSTYSSSPAQYVVKIEPGLEDQYGNRSLSEFSFVVY